MHGIAAGPEDRLFFSDSYGQLDPTPGVYVLLPPYTGTPELVSRDIQQPAGIEYANGNWYMCDLRAGQVREKVADQPGRGRTWNVPAPWNMARSDSGALLATTFDGTLVRLEPDSTTTELQTGLAAPFDLVFTDGGLVWISEQGSKPGEPGRVALWDPEQGVRLEARHSWATPEGLALDPEGNLWVAETEGRALMRVSPAGEVEAMAEVDGMPIAMTVLSSGDLLVSVTGPSPHLLKVAFGGS